jgi:formylglycine-generating enzyme required for sulfatase activity
LLPVESVSWRDAHEFANKLGLALPSEAQWEYAARCGDPRPLAFGSSDDLAALAGKENLNDRLGCESNPAPAALLSSPWCDGYWSVAPVMSFAPNAWGLHDLLGNVSEACSDVYVEAPLGGVMLGVDGRAPLEEGRFRSFRGASYATARAEAVRVAFRQWDRPQGTNHIRGVRVARPVR